MKQQRILFIDSYDSFTYNVVRLIEEQGTSENPIEVITIHNDTFKDIHQLIEYIGLFDGIVVGPGPGNPLHGSKEVGIINDIFQSSEFDKVPILGICLGFQAMCYSTGAGIDILDTIKHGQVYPINITDHNNQIFEKYPDTFKSTRYHSLHVTNFENLNTIIPLAYTNDENGKLLMATQISGKPWYGVQYHPESCCSELGAQLIQNFMKIIQSTNKSRYHNGDINKVKLLQNTIDLSPISDQTTSDSAQITPILKEYNVSQDPNLTFKICDKLNIDKFIMGSSVVSANRGEWSIIAIPSNDSVVITHYGCLKKTTIYKWQDESLKMKQIHAALNATEPIIAENLEIINEDKETFWHTLGKFMETRSVSVHQDIPFIGGLVGILGYEMGSYIHFNDNEILRPDAKLVYIENSIVINHVNGRLYTCSLTTEFPEEITEIVNTVIEQEGQTQLDWDHTLPKGIDYKIEMASKDAYAKGFDQCQKYMHQGDSYEMCLTTQTQVTPSQRLPPWTIFKTLIKRNPAPFSSFFHFNDILDNSNDILSFISTSPERFLKWDNQTCELRPIKGTVKKSTEMTLEKATEILKSPKEFGENLMILDLIRNDLYELLPNVKVEEFMSVEEYKTVYQLVSVVKAYDMDKSQYAGIDVLKYSLPPGSMTGAPKKITVELLQDKIENKLNASIDDGSRGMYSGVTGYWSANGNGDWSVNIRCMYSYDSGDHWRLGAGGAITVLSTQEGELEEMYTKLESALQVFM